MIASAALAAELEPQLVRETLLSDREHRAAENAAGRPLASAILGADRARLHRPDFALLGTDGERVVAIEVELTLKSRARLERIMRGYLRNRNVARCPVLHAVADRRGGTARGSSRRRRPAPGNRAAADDDVDDSETSMTDITVPLDHRLLTAQEVAELVRLPESTVYDLRRFAARFARP